MGAAISYKLQPNYCKLQVTTKLLHVITKLFQGVKYNQMLQASYKLQPNYYNQIPTKLQVAKLQLTIKF